MGIFSKLFRKDKSEPAPTKPLIPVSIINIIQQDVAARTVAAVDPGVRDDSVIHSQTLIKTHPGPADAWINNGSASLNRNQFEEALKYFDEAIHVSPQDAVAWSGKGVALANLGRNEEAIKSYDEAIRINPDHAGAWNNKGVALETLGRNEEAIDSYDEAIRINQKDADAWTNRGGALLRLGRNEEAIECLDEAIMISPRHTEAWSNKAFILSLRGQYQEAIDCCDNALKIHPQHLNAQKTKDMCVRRLKDRQERPLAQPTLTVVPEGYAARVAGINLDSITDVNAANTIGNRLINSGNLEMATKVQEKGVALNPNHVDAMFNLAVAYRLGKRFQEAEALCNKVLKLNPSDWDARAELEASRKRESDGSGQYERARREFLDLWRKQDRNR